MQPGWAEVSLAAGGHQSLEILAGSGHANAPYLILGSRSGTAPGFPVTGLTVPLVIDGYLLFTLENPNSAVLPQSLGQLDGNGRANAQFSVAPGSPAALAGLQLNHAAIAFDVLPLPAASFVSNALAVDLVQ